MLERHRNAASHYLVTIADLKDELGYARPVDVARRLGLTRGTVSITLNNLVRRGLVARDTNGFLLLTHQGNEAALSTRLKNQRFRGFLETFLKVSPEIAEEDCRRIDHVLSFATARRVCSLMQFLESGAPVVGDFQQAFAKFSSSREKGYCETCPQKCLLGTEEG